MGVWMKTRVFRGVYQSPWGWGLQATHSSILLGVRDLNSITGPAGRDTHSRHALSHTGGGGANVFMGPNPARGPAAESSQGWGHPARTGPPGQRVRGQAGPGRAVSENTQAAGRRAQGSPQPQLCFNFISLTSMQDRWLAACKVPPFAYLQEARWGGRAGAGEGGRAPS